LLFGREPRFPIENLTTGPHRYVVDDDAYYRVLKEHLETIQERARDSILKAQQRQKPNYDQRSKNVVLEVGDLVHLRIGNFREQATTKLYINLL